MTNYSIGSALIEIKNAAMAKNREIVLKNIKFVKDAALALKSAGYLESVEEKDGMLNLSLTYHKKEPVLLDLKLISKPGLRIYMKYDELAARRSPSILLLSTSKGVLSSAKAIKNHLGGEVIAEVY
jgi:small subunit ribosomal protein S8